MSARAFTCRQAWIKNITIQVLSVLGICCLPLLLYPGETRISFERLSPRHESSAKTISCILQDGKGFMWFATTSGLLRFDGYQFEAYKSDPEDPDSVGGEYINTLIEDRKGVIWVGTRKGISRYDRETGRFTTYRHIPGDPASLGHNDVKTVAEGRGGILWFGTSGGGLNKFDRETGRFTHYRCQPGNPNGLKSNEITALLIDNNGTPWVGTTAGLHKFDGEKERFIHYPYRPGAPEIPAGNAIRTLYEDREGVLWVGTRNGLNMFHRETGRFTRYEKHPGDPTALSGNYVLSLCEDSQGKLWIGTGDGLNRYNREKGTFIHFKNDPNDPRSLSSSSVSYVYPDRQGILWIGTWGGGLNLLDPGKRKFRHYTATPGGAPDRLNNNEVFSFYESPPGTVWIGTAYGGLNKFHRATQQFTYYPHDPRDPNTPSYGTIYSITGGKDGVLWLSTFGGGLHKFDPAANRFTKYKNIPGNPNSLSSDFVIFVKRDPSGQLWVGTRSGGLNRFDPENERFTHYRTTPGDPSSLSSDSISCGHIDRSGRLWVGTAQDGFHLFHRETGRFTRYQKKPGNPNSPGHDETKYIYEDHAGVFWIGTRGGGLTKFQKDKNKWTTYTTADGLPDNTVYGILEDDHGSLWFSTNKGISQFNPKAGTFTNYDTKDGLQADEFNSRACYRGPYTGEMYFGGINGFNAFFPGRVKPNPYIPPVAITAFKTFNQPVTFDKSVSEIDEIKIYSRDNFISFEFAALNYRNPEKNRYAYKLEGFDEQWVRAGTRRYAAYTNLGGGDYVFHVVGSNDNGVWNEKGVSVNVVVIPPFWRTQWFQALLLFALLAAVYLFHRLKVNRIVSRRADLEVLIQKRTKELERERLLAESANQAKSDFLARMSHEIRTPLNAVIGFNEMLQATDLTDEQRDYVRTAARSGELLLNLINDILDFARVESGKLTFEAVDFEPRLTAADVCDIMRPKTEGKPVDIHCRVGGDVPAFVNGDPGRFRQVLVNFMANAVKFTADGKIALVIELSNRTARTVTLHATVKDTGIGIPKDRLQNVFEVFQQADGSITRDYGGSGLGLAICKQISKLMNGDVWVESEPGKGSTFHFMAELKAVGDRPVKPAPAKPPARETIPVPDEANESICILLAEDNAVNRKLLRFMLNKAGYRVRTAENGKEAVEVFTRDPDGFDMIFMDVQMPELNGLEASGQIREKGFHRIPIIALTAQAMKGDREKCLEAGMNDYIAKPIKKETVLRKVRQWTGVKTGVKG